MAKERVRYVCSNCGEPSLSWAGKCPHCGAWNTLQEELVMESAPGKGSRFWIELKQSNGTTHEHSESKGETDDPVG